ncbi:DUF4339 domain-containing protein [Verrucomicrobiales bacterium]|nr:DUF4339 domain-containing protein [Verrucomicrobiales bacterium]
MRFLSVIFIFLICFFLTGCVLGSDDIWSRPSVFGLPLGVVLMIFLAIRWLNINNDENTERLINQNNKKSGKSTKKREDFRSVYCRFCGLLTLSKYRKCSRCGKANFKPVKPLGASKAAAQEKYKKHNEAERKKQQQKLQKNNPNLILCSVCAKDVSINANACPHCGEPNFKTAVEKPAKPTPNIITSESDKSQNPSVFYYHDVASNEVKGPYYAKELHDLLIKKTINEYTLVCREGSDKWCEYTSLLTYPKSEDRPSSWLP